MASAMKRQMGKPDGSLKAAPSACQAPPAASRSADFASADVNNPSFNPDKTEGVGNQPRVVVRLALRDDPLGSLRAHGAIDGVEYLAGRYWQELQERASVSRMKAIDPSRDMVDGGRAFNFGSDGQRMAMNKLAKANMRLGEAAASLVQHVLGAGMTIEQAAAALGSTGQWAIRGWRFVFRMALETLAVEFGLASPPAPPAVYERRTIQRAP